MPYLIGAVFSALSFLFGTDTGNQYLVELQAFLAITVIQLKIVLIENAWNVAKEILIQLNISGLLNTYWSQFDSNTLYYLTVFRIPECITVLFNARLTRMVLGYI